MATSYPARILFLSSLLLSAAPVFAQQTGAIRGKVTDTQGGALPGVTVEASSNVLPVARVTVTESDGGYRLPALPPGTYTLTFVLPGMQDGKRKADVQLEQETVADAALGISGVAETVTVTAEASLIDKDSATIANGLSNDQILALPVAQDYRDLQKFIPAVQISGDLTRGPSGGGSGQDNVYQFDGVNVTLPLFGTLSAEPATHDIDQVTVTRGAARAIDFERSGGFSIDSVSKSGTSQYHGQLSFQFMNKGMVSDLAPGVTSRYEQDRTWFNANLGGPVVKDRLYFYGSYYRPQNTRENRANLYGELPQYESTRNEGFGKLTFTPRPSILLNASYRDSKRVDTSDLFVDNASATTGSGSEARLKIATADGSWVIGSRSYATFKYTHFANETLGRPDFIADVAPSTAPGTRLDIANLDSLGRLTVPAPIAGQTAYNTFVQPLIDRYGYVQNGVHVGGGITGFAQQLDQDDFFRDSGQIGGNASSNISVGWEMSPDESRCPRPKE